jgi:lipopolysaccharide/colanic/teichoic acid biosynthesis glycosyltransferase
MFGDVVDSTSSLPGWKRAVDLLCCALALPLLAVSTAFVAVLMSMTSRGPIFFLQERVGYRGRRFRLYKFRTMHVAADSASHQAYFSHLVQSNVPMQKLDARRDSRLIPGGWLMRASGLDELPQIINICRGEMSIVGPRPCIPYEYEQYSSDQRVRFNSVPGLTGLWQVSGKNRTTFQEMINLDVEYGTRKSLWLDLKIIALTPYTLALQLASGRDRSMGSRSTHRDLAETASATTHHLSGSSSSAVQPMFSDLQKIS